MKLRSRKRQGQRDRPRRRAARRSTRRGGTSSPWTTGRLASTSRRCRANCARCWRRRSPRCPPEYRTALVLHDIEGLSNPDIAEALGISLPAVKSRIHRSRLFLRQRLSDYLKTALSANCTRRTAASRRVRRRHELTPLDRCGLIASRITPDSGWVLSMDAVIATGGKQYRVSPGQVISVEKVPGDKGARRGVQSPSWSTATARCSTGPRPCRRRRSAAKSSGRPAGARSSVIKFKRRKNYRRNRGHRQQVTMVRITGIEV